MEVLICDKNRMDIQKYKKWLFNIANQMQEDIQVITYDNVKKMLFEMEDMASQISLIYLENDFDNNLSGKDVVRKIRELKCKAEIIFLTSSNDKWPDGYDVGAFHYLLKSENIKRFNEVFHWVKDRIDRKEKKVMSFTYAGEKIVVEVDKIEYFESQGRIITVHYEDGQTFDFYSRMEKLENSLLPEGFIRIHRSYIVNRKVIDDYKNGVVKMRNGGLLPVSRNVRGLIKDIVK